MAEQDNLSEEEALERELWEQNGRYYTLEEMSDDMLGEAIVNIQNNESWRKDWLPALLCEKERRDELKETQEEEAKEGGVDFGESPFETAIAAMLKVRAARLLAEKMLGGSSLPKELTYDIARDTSHAAISVERVFELLKIAEGLDDRPPYPNIPGSTFTIEVVTEEGTNPAILERINEDFARVGKMRFLKALFNMDKFAKAASKLDDNRKSYQDLKSFRKFEKDKYRK